ncbi:CHAT domain-containing protein [Flavobacterium jejuense]|uniref:CHAT domain-containing protein n=1 Tax=Flavobacterium jejuense TaxID=1544455 RepID=A0ABX0IVD9_9FLAO|nr:CHAT domain-containing tetratricopeptide repeat protein [Flavobacterium jejuense]NHN25779.1 CHAT domain-containing protein [Flavobacterium jejuense]
MESLEKQTDNSIKLQQLLILLSKQNETTISPEMGILYATIGKQYYKNNDNSKAIIYLKKAIQIQKKFKIDALEVLNKTRNNLAWIYSYEGLEKERYQILQDIIDDEGTDKYTFNASIDCAVIESNKGDFYSGLSRLNVLLTKYNEIDKEIQLRAAIIGIYGKMYENVFKPRKQFDLEIIKKHQKIIESEFNSTGLNKTLLYTAYNNLAIVYDAFGNFDIALRLYKKVKKYYTLQEDASRFSVLNNIGFLYAKQGKYIEAIDCYKEVIAKSEDVKQIATAYDNMGYFLNDSSVQMKIPYFQKAIQILLENKQNKFTVPSLENIRRSGYQQDILIYLVDLAYHYVEAFKEDKDKKYLLQAKETLYRIDELVSLMRYESNAEQSKLFWIEKGVNTYLLAVEVCYLLKLPDEAFYFMEKNKALLLQENIRTIQAKLAFEIPKQLQEKEYKLHYELLALEKQFQQHSNDVNLKQKYAEKNKEFETFIDSIEKIYPKYVQLKKNIETISLSKVITANTNASLCFVTYILNEKEGFGIFCSDKEKIFFKVDNVPAFQDNLLVLKSYMKQPLLSKNEVTHFKQLGQDAFISLFPFKEALAKITNKKIIIVPDDTLLNLPFEALPVSTTGSLSESYLINRTAISYLQSFSVFEKIKQKKNQPKHKLLAIAPYQFEDNKLQELVRSKEAIQTLENYKLATILIEKQATKENFYKYSSDYEIIHLNTHAGFDSVTEAPWISFQKNKVTLDELYGINSQAELIILDACKTNDGIFASGEGILSLSRGFFYNGSKSVLASLWNVNEKAGNEIIKTFYSELEQGKSKAKALQFAKVTYLREHQYSEVLPYYWASFTLTGSTKAITISEKNPYLYGSIIVLITIIILCFLWYKRKLFFK